MRRTTSVFWALGAWIFGTVFGFTFSSGISQSYTSGDPVRAVGSPCDLLPPEQVGKVLRQPVISNDDRLFEPGESGFASADCELRDGDGPGELDLELERSGSDVVRSGAMAGIGTKRVTVSGAEVAAGSYQDDLHDAGRTCQIVSSGPVTQAAACHLMDDPSAYRVIAHQGDLVATVTAHAVSVDQQQQVRYLALVLVGGG